MTPTLTPFSHDDLLAAIDSLVRAVREDAWQPQRIVGIGRGGLTPAVYLSHALGVPMVSLDLSGGSPGDTDRALAALAERATQGERLLIVDDINDSGATISRVRDAFAAPASPRVAVLIDNQTSRTQVDYRFRVIDRRVTKDWFVFPWESVAPTPALEDEAQAVPERLA